MTGGVYDLITFQPRHVYPSYLRVVRHLLILFGRGTGITIPYSCYNSSEASAAAFAAMPQALGAPEVAIEKGWTVAEAQADACYQNAAVIGRLVGTSFVARDM